MTTPTQAAPDKPRLSLWDHEIRLHAALDELADAERDGREPAEDMIAIVRDYTLTAAEKRDRMTAFLVECDTRAEMYAREMARMKARTDALERAADRLRSYVVSVMQAFGTRKLEGVTSTLSLQKNPPRVEVTGPVPGEYERVVPETREPDKVAIKRALQAGEFIPNCRLIDGEERLTIR